MTELTAEERERFKGSLLLFGEEGYLKLKHAHVMVLGVGGVGSPCAEALCRCGVGEISLYDCDEIELSNTNRQLHTLSSTLGHKKTAALKSRLMDINPYLVCHEHPIFVTRDNIDEALKDSPLYCAECIDDIEAKAAAAAYLKAHDKIFVVSGGAGGRVDPTRLKLADLGQAHGDGLISHLRTILRRDYGFGAGCSKFAIMCSYSDEKPRYHEDELGRKSFGALMAVTASAGLLISSYLISKITGC